MNLGVCCVPDGQGIFPKSLANKSQVMGFVLCCATDLLAFQSILPHGLPALPLLK